MIHNNEGPIRLDWRSDFDLIWLELNGRHDEMVAVVADLVKNRRNVARVFTRCWNLFKLEETADYWKAVEVVRATLNNAGAYFNPVFIVDRRRQEGKDWITMMDDAATDVWVSKWRQWCKGKDGVIPSLVNEPEQPWQGYSGPTDERLIQYTKECSAEWGHKDFIIGAAADGDDPDASAETIAMSVELARYVNLLAIHNSRKGGASPDGDTRIRRYIDHLEGFFDIIAKCRSINPDSHGVHEEPTGQASVHFVDLGGGRTYEREYDPEMALAAALTSAACGLSYCYHRIRSQDVGQPGIDLIAKVLANWPAGWGYLNDSWGGSPTRGWNWRGGKLRSYVAPPNARSFVYGFPEVKPSGDPMVWGEDKLRWQNGYHPTSAFDGGKVVVFKVSQ